LSAVWLVIDLPYAPFRANGAAIPGYSEL